jgi:hypothetical protein
MFTLLLVKLPSPWRLGPISYPFKNTHRQSKEIYGIVLLVISGATGIFVGVFGVPPGQPLGDFAAHLGEITPIVEPTQLLQASSSTLRGT